MTKQVMVVAATLGLASACSSTHERQCTSSTACDLAPGGECAMFAETGNQWCQYPDADCPSGMRWSDFETGDGLSGECVGEEGADASVPDAMNAADAGAPDATIDATPGDTDAPPLTTSFDVAFVDTLEWQNSSPSSFSNWSMFRVINTGTAPLNLSTAEFSPVASNDDRWTIELIVIPLSTPCSSPASQGVPCRPSPSLSSIHSCRSLRRTLPRTTFA